MNLQMVLRNQITMPEIIVSTYIVVASWLMHLIVYIFTVVLLIRFLLPAAAVVALGVVLLYFLRHRYLMPSLPIARWIWWSLVLFATVLASIYSYISGILTVEHIRSELAIGTERIEYSAMLLDDVINNGTTSDGGTRYIWGLYQVTEPESSAFDKLKLALGDQEYWNTSSSERFLMSAHCDYSEEYAEPPGIFIDLDSQGRLGISIAVPAPHYCYETFGGVSRFLRRY